VSHPAAEAAREALSKLQSIEAAKILAEALAKEPNNPELLCEKAMVGLFNQTELESLKLLPKTASATRHEELELKLAEHFTCVRQAKGVLSAEATALLARVPVDFSRVGCTITACLIVKNEAKHIARCLQSVKSVVDEIVVVDTGSTDETVAIAESFGAKIGYYEWTNDFAAARNVSLSLATGHWILWIDADEELTEDSAKAFREASIRPQFGGYNIEIVNFVDDREDGGKFVHSPIRLFRNLPGIQFVGSVHEQVVQSIDALGLPWARLDNAKLLHYGYRPSEVAAKGKQERTISMIEAALEADPEDGFQWFNLANALTIGREYERAAEAARTALSITPNAGETFGELAYQILALSLAAIGKLKESLKVCDEAVAANCGGMLIEFERAQTLMKIGRHRDALAAIDKAMEATWRPGQSGDRGIETFKRYIVRGQILALLGRNDEALDMFNEALKVDPSYSPCLFCKAATLERMGRFEEAAASYRLAGEEISVRQTTLKGEARCYAALGALGVAATRFKEAWKINQEDIESWIGWCDCCTAAGDGACILEAYEEYAKVGECSAGILVNWGRALVATGDNERALNLFTEAIQRDPENPNAYFNCGDLLFQMGYLHDAAHLYENGLRHDPENAEAWFVLGNSLAKIGIIEGAVISYRETLRIRPDHLAAQHNLEQVAA
jgi:tetratricopeptide (TPR) repeat protein